MESKHILLLEDEPATLALFTEILKSAGYRVTGVRDGGAAVRAANRDKPDLFISDLGVPGLDGFATISMFRRMGGFEAPIIVISGHTREEDRLKATNAGAQEFLAKPVPKQALLAAVSRLLAAGSGGLEPPPSKPETPEGRPT